MVYITIYESSWKHQCLVWMMEGIIKKRIFTFLSLFNLIDLFEMKFYLSILYIKRILSIWRCNPYLSSPLHAIQVRTITLDRSSGAYIMIICSLNTCYTFLLSIIKDKSAINMLDYITNFKSTFPGIPPFYFDHQY